METFKRQICEVLIQSFSVFDVVEMDKCFDLLLFF